ncbi:hypothetical protein Pmani_003352 [Petrolisthes manimaculis]|uniref:Uncharacterized protein n=1 Tax=Petrolisthes manimaculis TaxID=1843537 RepID=A0AAE1QGG0_9EUCA|nr:hypothetical protein Pmani_003352 [Petrolisthes manimaculis]
MAKIIFSYVLFVVISSVVGRNCYVCKDQDENTGKCTTTISSCDYGEEYCLSEIKWGSKPYWEIGAPMQHFISKRCATREECVNTITKYMPNCLRIWWKDWTCAECCKGERCNYYITLGSSTLHSSMILITLASMFAVIVQCIS